METGYITEEKGNELLDDCAQLICLLRSITKTTIENSFDRQ